MSLAAQVSRLVNSDLFGRAVVFLIVLNGLYLGAETTPPLNEINGALIEGVLTVSLWLFVLEIALRLLAHWPNPGQFFRSPWNCFDFTVVALSLLPVFSSYLLAARLFRVLRLLRLFSGTTTLRRFFSVRDGDPPLTIVWQWVVSVVLLGYVFALAGVYLFGEVVPADWGSLRQSAGSVVGLLASLKIQAFLDGLEATGTVALAYVGSLYVTMGAFLAGALLQLALSVRHAR